MVTVETGYPNSPVSLHEPGARRTAFMGSYMPFAGVRYYRVFGIEDIVEGSHKIGPVGWRPPKRPASEDRPEQAKVPALALT
ncbi:MAG: hypothetical protein L0177_16525 [Chloroflexi bacterium]|nr:hypothetical protein [Chloroflexota bacterium]